MVTPKHILGTFDEALSNLRNDLLTMAGLTERSLYNAINGLLQRDDSLCIQAIADDEEVDRFASPIDQLLRRRRWPVCKGYHPAEAIH